MDYDTDWAEWQKEYDAITKKIQADPIMKSFGIARYRDFATQDGCAFHCILTYEKRIVGEARNDGNGGPDDVDFTEPMAKTAWDKLEALAGDKPEPHAMVLDALLKLNNR